MHVINNAASLALMQRKPYIRDHGDRFLNEFVEFIQKPVPVISCPHDLRDISAWEIYCEIVLTRSGLITRRLKNRR